VPHSESITEPSDVVDQFTDRLASAGGQAHHVASSSDAATLIADLAGEAKTIWASPVVAETASALVRQLTDRGLTVRFDGDPTSVRDQAIGLSIARNTIAETGSALLVEPSLAERSVSLMTQTLIVLSATSALLPGLDEAAPVLREVSIQGASYATFVTGPSRTADIERQLTVGVQGPAVYHVILIDDLS
jgi:L-lactate dehydrogenase complex protein LldG